MNGLEPVFPTLDVSFEALVFKMIITTVYIKMQLEVNVVVDIENLENQVANRMQALRDAREPKKT